MTNKITTTGTVRFMRSEEPGRCICCKGDHHIYCRTIDWDDGKSSSRIIENLLASSEEMEGKRLRVIVDVVDEHAPARTMGNKLDELKAAALAATPGPWLIADENTPWNILDAIGFDVAISQQRTTVHHNPKQTDRTANAKFIAAANPAAVLALLAELEFEKQNNAGVAGMVEDYETKLEAKDERIAELEQLPTIKHMRSVEEALIRTTDMVSELEKLLATPVRLPNKNDDEFWFDGVFQVAKFDRAVERAIRAAGFIIEGDE